MPSLSAQERVELQQAVSVHGRDWRAMAAAGACGTALLSRIMNLKRSGDWGVKLS